MIKLEEPNARDALARRYGLLNMVSSTPLTIDAVKKLALAEVLKIGECPNEKKLKRLARKFNAGYGIHDAERLIERQYKIPWEARAGDTLILFPGAVLGLGFRLDCYRAMPAFYFCWNGSTGQFHRRAVWFDSAPSLSRGFFLVPSP